MNEFLVYGEIKKVYSISTGASDLFEYLSNVKMLLTSIPHVNKIQLRTNSGRARLFCSMRVAAASLDVMVDVEPEINQAGKVIKLNRPLEPLGGVPDGWLEGTFSARVEISDHTTNTCKVATQLELGFDPGQVNLLKVFPRSFLKTAGSAMLQEFVEQTSQNYINSLAKGYPDWLRTRQLGA